MKPPALEFRLILTAAGMGWEYIARSQGQVIAASDGDAHYENAGKALIACAAEVRAWIAERQNGGAE